ncbi:Ephrin-B2a [Nymphon striatum]|nr:Ephrin-B2a [Nymphon striatum]
MNINDLGGKRHSSASDTVRFRIDNTDHIIDVNKNNLPFEYDQVNIICPSFHSGTSAEDSEQYIIYNVSKEEYDSCRITTASPRIIAICDKPTKLMYFTITFRSFTPQPGGLEFRPGQDYYFISTSNGKRNGLRSLVGGRCGTHNMKIIFKVCCDKKSGKDTKSALGISSFATTLSSTTKKPHRKSFIPPYKPPSRVSSTEKPKPPRYRPQWPNTHEARDRWQPSVKILDVPRDSTTDTKKKKKNKVDRDKSPNDARAKNELLKKNHATSINISSWFLSVTCVIINYFFTLR